MQVGEPNSGLRLCGGLGGPETGGFWKVVAERQ